MIDARYFNELIGEIVEYESVLICITWENDLADLIRLKKRLLSKKNLKITIGTCTPKSYKMISEALSDDVIYIHNEDNGKLNYDVIIFDETYSRDVWNFDKYGVKMLIGNITHDLVDYYDIWRRFRNLAERMYIHVWTENQTFEVLSWKAGEYEKEVSIILPVYNVAKYLDKCFETILKADMEYIEVLAVDDGSPDNSAEIIKGYEKKDSRVKLISKQNGGCASARQKGLEVAKGRFVAFVDPDDFVTYDAFYKLHRRILLNSYDFALGGYYKYYETTGKSEKVYEGLLGQHYNKGICDPREVNSLIHNATIAIWRGLYRKSFLDSKNIGFNESIKRFDDLPFMMEVAAKASSFVSIPDYIYYYRLERPGQDVAINDERLFVHFEIFDDMNKNIVGPLDDAKITDQLQLRKIDTHMWGYKKLQRKYRRKYKKMAKKDMLRNSSRWNNMLLFYRYRGFKGLIRYIRFMH